MSAHEGFVAVVGLDYHLVHAVSGVTPENSEPLRSRETHCQLLTRNFVTAVATISVLGATSYWA